MIVIVVLAVVVVAVGWLSYRTGREVISEVKVLTPTGNKGTALVVYHPGLSDFQQRMTYAFAEGLVSGGWRVEITTASSQAPKDLSQYGLLVFGAPTYGFAPPGPIRRYLAGLDLEGKRTAIIITGLGATGQSVASMERLVRDRHGDLVKSLSLTTMRPNSEEDRRPNKEVAVEMATRAGSEIPLPGR